MLAKAVTDHLVFDTVCSPVHLENIPGPVHLEDIPDYEMIHCLQKVSIMRYWRLRE